MAIFIDNELRPFVKFWYISN